MNWPVRIHPMTIPGGGLGTVRCVGTAPGGRMVVDANNGRHIGLLGVTEGCG